MTELRLNGANLDHVLQFKFKGCKPDSYPLIELLDNFFRNLSELYLNVVIRVSYQKL
jgi:hypothetical protein